MKFPNVDHIYIICCGKFKNRRHYLENKFKSLKFDESYYTFTMDDPNLNFSANSYWESLNQEIIEEYYTLDTEERKKELTAVDQVTYMPAKVSLPDIAVSINHLLVWKDVLLKKYDNVMILEDDIIFFEDSVSKLLKIIDVLPDDYDLISLEDGAMMHASMFGHKIVPNQLLYKIESGRMRCTGSYFITNKACKVICDLQAKKKWTLEIDFIIDLYGRSKLLTIYWAEPCVFSQGSQIGRYPTGVQDKKHINSCAKIFL